MARHGVPRSGAAVVRRGPSLPPVRTPRDPVARLALVLGSWLVTRVLLLVISQAEGLYPAQDDPFEISVLAGWGAAFAGDAPPGTPVPLRDGPWEYPAGAAVVLALPALLRGAPYVLGFVAEVLLVGAALVLLLALWGVRPHGSLAGAWLWVAAVPLLGPVALARFDVVPTALAAAGLLAAPAAPLLAGVLLGAGTAVKLWPALLVPLVLLLHPGRDRLMAGVTAVGAAVAGIAAVLGAGPQLLSLLSYQRERGLEVESVPALPLMAARATGDDRVSTGFAFGSYEVTGPSAQGWLLAGDLGLLLVLLGAAVLAVRTHRRGADPVTAVPVLAVLLVAGVLLCDKVLSAQYPLWLAGLLAVALAGRASPLRAAALPLCGALALTQAVYPLAIQDLLAGRLRPVLLLGLRDLLLLVVAALAARAAWRLQPASEDVVPVHEQHREQAEPGG